jgi:Ca-activated chloride channel family protein
VPLDTLGANRDRLTSAVNGLRANGNTALYDAILGAAEKLHAQRDQSRINAVLVMTDGKENASRRVSSRAPQPLVNALRDLERKSGTPVLVFAVAYGDDTDLGILQFIAESTRGQAYQGNPETIRKLYQLLSAFF